MVTTRWVPQIERDLDALMDRMVRRAFGPETREGTLYPTVDVVRRDSGIEVRMEIPGIDPERDLDIEVEGGMLRIEGRKELEREAEEGDWYVRESATGTFRRRLSLPEGVDPDRIEARYDAGVLTLTIPVPEQPEARGSRRIQVGTGGAES